MPIDPAKLLEHAREFADHHPGPGRPRPILLRRAVSAAYYAVFHAVALAVAHQILGWQAVDDDHHHRLARSVDHGALSEVCGWVAAGHRAGREQVRPIVAALQSDERARRFADIVVRLQQERHRADYDHTSGFRKVEVTTLLDHASWALRQVGPESDADFSRLSALIALRSSLR